MALEKPDPNFDSKLTKNTRQATNDSHKAKEKALLRTGEDHSQTELQSLRVLQRSYQQLWWCCAVSRWWAGRWISERTLEKVTRKGRRTIHFNGIDIGIGIGIGIDIGIGRVEAKGKFGGQEEKACATLYF